MLDLGDLDDYAHNNKIIENIKYIEIDYPIDIDEPSIIIGIYPKLNVIAKYQINNNKYSSVNINVAETEYTDWELEKIFKKIKKLCDDDKLANLSLSFFTANYNINKDLPKLNSLQNLYKLDLYYNKYNLSILPELPDNLYELYCVSNNINKLPDKLPSNLRILSCSYNNINILPEKMPFKLHTLLCPDNNLEVLPIDLVNINIRNFNCGYNNLIYLPELKQSICKLHCENNKLTDLPILSYNMESLCINDNNIKYLSKRNCKAILKIYYNIKKINYFNINYSVRDSYNLINNPFMYNYNNSNNIFSDYITELYNDYVENLIKYIENIISIHYI